MSFLPLCALKTPVSIYYPGGEVQFPLNPSSKSFQAMVSGCMKASFGMGGERVMDESYRKALVLDKFGLAIHPSDSSLGLIHAIEDALIPSKKLYAELYKLNVYTPGGFFKSHVDTPRGPNFFGSLVICLPVPHKGGALRIHSAQSEASVLYDWSQEMTVIPTSRKNAKPSSPAMLHWAAFFGDCRHEILPIESGNRVTLTYNLFFEPIVSPAKLPSVDTVNMELLEVLQNFIAGKQNKSGKESGGTADDDSERKFIGFYLVHRYPALDRREIIEPHHLKGVDAVVANTFQAAGLTPTIRPVYDFSYWDGDESVGIAPSTKVSELPPYLEDYDEEYTPGYLKEKLELDMMLPRNIYWMNVPRQHIHHSSYGLGNDPSYTVLYYNVALLVDVTQPRSKKQPRSKQQPQSKKQPRSKQQPQSKKQPRSKQQPQRKQQPRSKKQRVE